jgi:parallel beta-helix repeat protein
VSVNAARVGGKVASTAGGRTSYWAEFGRTRSYGSETTHQSVTLARGIPQAVAVTIDGLDRAARYHYRLCARDSETGSCGADRVVTTQSVACGETVTADVRLTGDLDCGFDGLGPGTGGTGLVIGANGIDVNLGGHSMSSFVNVGGADVRGIDNSGGHDDVTIRNGGLGLWGHAIHLEGAGRNRVVGVSAQGSPYGVLVDGGEDNELRDDRLSGRVTGLLATGQASLVVAHSTLSGSFGPAMDVEADDAVIAYDEVAAGQPIAGPAVRLGGSRNRVFGNRIGGGGFAGSAIGLRVDSGAGNRLIGNEVFGAGLDPGGGSGDGILVTSLANGTLLRGNFAHDNADDGIDVRSAATRLRDNRADGNGDLGIDAVAGVTDLGGNRASGNGNPLQCINVFCEH